MTITLATDVEEFLREQVRSDVCADASELLNDVMRSIREQQHKPFEATAELEVWLLEAADQPASLLQKEDFALVRERVRARVSSDAP